MKDYTKLNKCGLCGKYYKDIQKHVNKIHKITYRDYELKLKNEFIKCEICGKYFKNVQVHVWRSHKMKIAEYRLKYNLTKEDCYPQEYLKKCSKNIKGDKNPGYKHGGKLSPLSKKFIKYENKTDDEVNNILNDYNQDRSEKMKNGSAKRCKNYWIKKGYTEEEAKEAVSNHQRNFSLDICVDKYGFLVGYNIWFKRQIDWQKTLNSKPQEEIDEINRNKVSFNNCIKSKDDFLEKVKEEFNKLSFVQKESWSFDFWFENVLYIQKTALYNFFENDMKKLYKEITKYIKDSFKNNPKIFKHKGRNYFNMYTDNGELLRSSYEINFYFLLKKNEIEHKVNQHYPNSKMSYDFYLSKYNLYVEIAGAMIKQKYKEKMILKHQKFDSIILKSEKEQESFIKDLKYGRYKKKNKTFDMFLLFS